VIRGERGSNEDDELFDALAGRGPAPGPAADDPVVRALQAWTYDLDRDLPPGEPLDPRLIRVDGPSARRLVRPAVAAAAVIGILLGGGTVAVRTAQPGGVFWGMSRLVDPDRAASLEARAEATECLSEAERDILLGQPEDARRRLAEARGRITFVRSTEGRAVLDVRLALLEQRLRARENPPAPPPTGQPAPPQPAQTGTGTPTAPTGAGTSPAPGRVPRTQPRPPSTGLPQTASPSPEDPMSAPGPTGTAPPPSPARLRMNNHVTSVDQHRKAERKVRKARQQSRQRHEHQHRHQGPHRHRHR
jgi:hypothetical protein